MGEKPRVGVGLGVMLLRNGRILLGKRNTNPETAGSELHGEGTWTMPGGKLEFGETFEDGVCRETFEETGIKINKEKIKFISVSNDRVEDAHFVTLGFLCEESEGEAEIKEPDEITEWKWFPLDNLPSPIFFCSQEVLDNYLSKSVYGKSE
jgi:8-oxo-dGTP diphosphatase